MRTTTITLSITLLALIGCSGPRALPETVQLGLVEDVLAGPGAVEELVETWPTTFLVGEARGVAELLEMRTRLAESSPEGSLVTLVDAAGLDPIESTALADQLMDAALDEGGPVLLDRDGQVSRRLSGVASRPALIRVSAEHIVLARTALSGASPEEQALALGQGR